MRQWYVELGACYKGAIGFRVGWIKSLSMNPSPSGSPRSASLCQLPLQLESKMSLTINWLGLPLIQPLQDLSQTPLSLRDVGLGKLLN